MTRRRVRGSTINLVKTRFAMHSRKTWPEATKKKRDRSADLYCGAPRALAWWRNPKFSVGEKSG